MAILRSMNETEFIKEALLISATYNTYLGLSYTYPSDPSVPVSLLDNINPIPYNGLTRKFVFILPPSSSGGNATVVKYRNLPFIVPRVCNLQIQTNKELFRVLRLLMVLLGQHSHLNMIIRNNSITNDIFIS